MSSSDPFERAKSELEQETQTKRAQLEREQRAIDALFSNMGGHKDSLARYGLKFQRSVSKFSDPCVLLWFASDTTQKNAIVAYHPHYSENPLYIAQGGVLENYRWNEETHKREDESLSTTLGHSPDEVMNCIARSALKGKLPAIGSVLDRGSYEIATGSQVKVGEYFAAIIVSPIIGASWSVVALILAAVSGHWNDAQRLATFAGVLGTIVFLCLLWPKKKDP